jgi:hypothetical protein
MRQNLSRELRYFNRNTHCGNAGNCQKIDFAPAGLFAGVQY